MNVVEVTFDVKHSKPPAVPETGRTTASRYLVAVIDCPSYSLLLTLLLLQASRTLRTTCSNNQKLSSLY
jgi:hypothetical protein